MFIMITLSFRIFTFSYLKAISSYKLTFEIAVESEDITPKYLPIQ